LLAGNAGLYVILDLIKLLEVQEWNAGGKKWDECVGEAHSLCCYFAPKLTNNHDVLTIHGAWLEEHASSTGEVDELVVLGQQQRFACRLVARRVPLEVWQTRVEKARLEAFKTSGSFRG
jgi:hypothetical protein